jgi:hypothetical protein
MKGADDLIRTKLPIKRNPMISIGFKRVSKKRPCQICGEPTYCGFSRDEGTSICMRVSWIFPPFADSPPASALSIPKFHSSRFDQQLRSARGTPNQLRRTASNKGLAQQQSNPAAKLHRPHETYTAFAIDSSGRKNTTLPVLPRSIFSKEYGT